MNMRAFARFSIVTTLTVGLILIYTIGSATRSDPTSIFFSPEKGYKSRYSVLRHQQAKAFVDTYNSTLKPEAVKRRQIYLIVFISHADPTAHPALNETWLHHLTDQVLTHGPDIDDEQMQHIRDMEEDGQFEEKGLYDYSYLLSKCMEQQTPHIAIFEDDTLAMDGWYHRTMDAIRYAERQSASRREEHFLYLRIFTPKNTWAGTQSTGRPALLLFLRSSKPHILLSRTIGASRAIIGIYALLAISTLVLFALGRLTVLPLSIGLHEMLRYGCCSQALVFPRQKAVELVEFFEERHTGFVDVLIEEFADERQELRFAITPSVVQHVGKMSSKTTSDGSIYKEKIWSFAF
ncbi:Nn.00g065760.m01.CDS01 [Neocucurbitaria sp. VM-36]